MGSWRAEVEAALGARVEAAEPVSGGDINDAFRARLADGRAVFVKTRARAPAGMYEAEARGLAWLGEGPLRVPRVLAAGAGFLALEWLEPSARGPGFDEALGRGLAGLHALGAPRLGAAEPGYLATLPLPAVAAADAAELWIEHRVRPAAEIARARGRLPDVRARLDALRARPDRFGAALGEPPARLHGDLWWGNVMAVGGAPVLIDPAAYGGPREIDLAMLALFGGLPARVVAAYEEVAPLPAGWRERVPLWQLYPLAVHAALFGGGYGAQVVRALDALV